MKWEDARVVLMRPSPAGIRRLSAGLEELQREWSDHPERIRGEGAEYARVKRLFGAARRFHEEWGRLGVTGTSYGPGGVEAEARGSVTLDIAG